MIEVLLKSRLWADCGWDGEDYACPRNRCCTAQTIRMLGSRSCLSPISNLLMLTECCLGEGSAAHCGTELCLGEGSAAQAGQFATWRALGRHLPALLSPC